MNFWIIIEYIKKDLVTGLFFGLIKLCTGGDVGVDLEQVELFFVVFLMDGGDEHTAALYSHHRAGRQIRYCYTGFSYKLFRLVESVNTG